MPHQCLKCGKIFEEGSSQLLKGCPDCAGNRFFFTKEPLDEKERSIISNEVEQDITTKLIDLIGDKNKDLVNKSGKWMSVKPKEIRKMIEEQQNTDIIQKDHHSTEKEDILNEEYRKAVLEKLKAEQDTPETPETIDIKKPGEYKIDIKGLLEQEPIIIQKDGSYTIHLPSIFKMINKEK